LEGLEDVLEIGLGVMMAEGHGGRESFRLMKRALHQSETLSATVTFRHHHPKTNFQHVFQAFQPALCLSLAPQFRLRLTVVRRCKLI